MLNKEIIEKYKEMKAKKNRIGDYKKTLFHVHTPASYDYRFKSGWNSNDYKRLSEEDLFHEHIISSFDKEIAALISEAQLEGDFAVFETKKDFYSYLLLANQLLENDYEIVVISDHNTTKGILKLQAALDSQKRDLHKHCNVIYGVEITCADRLHVVGMFREEQLGEVEQWLSKHLISEEYGVMKSSYDVLKDFYDKKCYAYIAHINTSELFSQKNVYSGGYKKELLSDRYSKFIGVNSEEEIPRYNDYFTNIYKSNKHFILDCDAHSHEEVPTESMWVKVANNSTHSFFEALEEYQITVSLEVPQIPSIFIEGLHIDYNKEGYLAGKSQTNYCVRYSPSLNSYIGGRGTGKSTALDLINFVLTQEFKDDSHLYFFSQHGRISVLVHYYDEEYLVTLELPHFGSAMELIAELSSQDPSTYREKIYYNENRVKQKILRSYVSVYKIIKTKSNEFVVEKQSIKKATIEKFYDDRYSINSLVEKANNNEFGGFIQDLFFSDGYLDALGKKANFKSNKGLLKFFDNIEKILEERKGKVESRIDPYNLAQKDKMRIIYIQKNVNAKELPHSMEVPKSRISKKYDITQEEATEYIHYLIRKLSFNEFIKLCISKTNSVEVSPLSSFARNQREPNIDKKSLTPSNSYDATVVLLDDFLKANNINRLLTYYKDKLNTVEEFTIEFDVNAYETSRPLKSIFKDIKNLSLGQKVVTILNLILSHGDFSNNHKPVIIDQPEDNLDSRYIYKNLVGQLRQLKEKRQIIIATHNSTLVTNSLSENVIVMDSDGEHGWISKCGYALSYPIKKEILNILEGGEGSFKHRQIVFNDVIS